MNEEHKTAQLAALEEVELEAADIVRDLAAATDAAPEKLEKRKKHWWRHKDVNRGEESFASGLNLYKLIWVFIIGSFLGVLLESAYTYMMNEGQMHRVSGMLYGPFNQVYGFGAVLFTLILYRFRKKNALIIFLGSALIGGFFEYVCSWVQQVLFGSQSWEYSDMPTNIGGRTNLFYMVAWGVLGLLFVTHMWPWLSEMIERIPNRFKIKRPWAGKAIIITGRSLTIAFIALLAVDLALTAAAVYRAGRRNEGQEPAWVADAWLDEHYPNKVMAEKFPNMTFVNRFSTRPEPSEDMGEEPGQMILTGGGTPDSDEA